MYFKCDFPGVTQQTHQLWHCANYKGHECDLLILITTMALSALNRLLLSKVSSMINYILIKRILVRVQSYKFRQEEASCNYYR